MANDARSTRKVKNDESDSRRGKQNSKPKHSSGAAIVDTSGLRRSLRGTQSKTNMTPSPSSTRKSKRLEKQIPINTPIKMKDEGVDNKSISSSLRRSERGRNHSLAISSGSKKVGKSSASYDVKRRSGKKEMTVEELPLQTIEVGKNGKKGMKNAQVAKKRMDARTYRDLFKRLPKKVNASDHAQFTCNNDKSTEGDDNNCRGGMSEKVDGDDECNRSWGEELGQDHVSGAFEESNYVKERTESEVEVERSDSNQQHVSDEEAHTVSDGLKDSETDCVLISSDHAAIQRNDGAGKAELDYAIQNKLQTQRLDSVINWVTGDVDNGLERGNESISFKRRRNSVDVDLDIVASVALEDMHTEIANATASSPSGCKSDEICVSCSKRRRRESEAGVTTVHVEGCDNHTERESFVESRLDFGQHTCLVCKLGGTLLCCAGRGCKRRYHLSCLSPPLVDVPLGIWLCLDCVKKKIELGVHSVTDGIESIWDVREKELPDDYGLARQKQFFVKYKGLAHVHNRWVPESQLILEAPLLVEEFNKKDQVAKWKQEWTVPRRFLQKRLLPVPKQYEEDCSGHVDRLDCQYEWLVKWCGLDYEHSTWELDNTSFMKSQEAVRLVRDFQSRHEKEMRAVASSNLDKVFETKKETYIKLSQFPSGFGPRIDNNHLDFVNNLSECWHKGQNALVVDEQEHIAKVILFILSLSSYVGQPFLIISTSDIFYSWDDEFMRSAPSLQVVVYHGDKDVRKSIRTLEFYEEGCVMFQVLITSPEVIVEDLSFFECIKWESIVVDECQLPGIFSHLVCFKMLRSDMILLLVSGQLKDDVAEHLLCLLDYCKEFNVSDRLTSRSHDNDSSLKDRLSRYIVDRCKSDSSRFVEFWLPIELSNLQLEQYCSTLLSNSLSLCSSSKGDPVGALRNILHSIRKCCDHPYLTDSMLPVRLNKEFKEEEFLDVGIKASGKLQLLEAMLFEIKKRGLRVLILFQSCGGSGTDNIGDYLDDFLRQRFGPDSYERIDLVVATHKRQAALNKFNNDKGRFVFLLETRACTPGIKLSSVDSVIIFGSDWNPVNDVRLLQRVTFDSQYKHLKLFRLYSSYTVEEKALILAKEDKAVDSNLQNTNRNTSNLLLMWGASYLFNRLDEFHQGNGQAFGANISLEKSLLKDVIREFLTVLTQNGEESDTSDCSLILKVKQNQGYYETSYPLFSELKIQLTYEGDPHIFWKKLLDGKQPRWRYSSGPSKRNRKRVQYFENLLKKPEVGVDNVVKKRKKVVNNNIEPLSPRPVINGEIGSGNKEGSLGNPEHDVSQSFSGLFGGEDNKIYASTSLHLVNKLSEKEVSYWIGPEDGTKLDESQNNLSLSMKPEIVKICEVLQLPEDVKGMVEKFLEYLMNNHHVNREPVTILQAFQISLCWTAASMLKQRIDRKESLALAKQHLKFSCSKEEADYIYSMLRCLKTTFLNHTEKCSVACCKESELSAKDVSQKNSSPNFTLSATSKLQEGEVEVRELPQGQECYSKQVVNKLSLELEFELAQKDLSRSIKIIRKKCEKQMSKLLEKQQEEKEDLDRKYREEIAKLQNRKRTELAVIRSYASNSILADKLKSLDNEYTKKFEELKCQMDIRLKDLEAMQLTARNKLQERGVRWVEGLKSWAQAELLNVRPSDKGCSKQGNIVNPCSEALSPDVVLLDGEVHETVGVSDCQEEVLPVNLCTSERQTVGPISSLAVMPDGDVQSEVHETVGVSDCQEEVLPVILCTSERQTVGPISSLAAMPYGEVQSEVHETVGVSDCQEEVLPVNLCTSERQTVGPISSLAAMPDGEVQSEVHEIVGVSDCQEEVLPVNLCMSEKHTVGPISSLAAMPDGEVQSEVHETISVSDCQEEVLPVNLCTSERQTVGPISSVAERVFPIGVPMLVNCEDDERSAVFENERSCEQGLSHKEVQGPETLCSPDGPDNTVFVSRLPLEGQNPDVPTSSVPDVQVQLQVPGIASCSNGLGIVVSGNQCLINCEDGESSTVFENECSCEQGLSHKEVQGSETLCSPDGPDNTVFVSRLPLEGQTLDVPTSSVPDEQIQLEVPGIASCINGMGVVISGNQCSSSEQISNGGSMCVSYGNSPSGSAADVTMGGDTSRENGVASDSARVNQPDGVGCNINHIFHFSDNITAFDPQDKEVTFMVPETAPTRNEDHVASSDNNISGVNQQNGVVFTSRDDDGANPVALQYPTGVNLSDEVVCIVNQMSHSLDSITGSDEHGGEVAAGVPETVSSQLMEGFSTGTSNDDSVISDRVEQQNENVSTSKENDSANHVASDYATGVDRPDGLDCINNQMLNSLENTPGSYLQGGNGTATVQGTAPSQLIEDVNTRMRNDDFVPSNNNIDGVNLENGVLFTTIPDSLSQDLSSVNSQLVQPATAWAQSCTMPLNQALHDECSPPAITTTPANRDASISGEQTTLQQVEIPLADSFDFHARVTDPLVQQQLTSSVGCPSSVRVQYLPSTREMSNPCSERHIINLISQPPGLPENRVEISNQPVLQSATCLAPHLPIDAPAGGLGRPVSDIRNTSITSRNSNHPVQNASSFMPQMPPSYHDPLQSEMERIHKERDQSIINHEGTKLLLKSDCDKEIEEVVAQIRKKYEIKLQEVEAEFLTKKKDMDENLNKVLMNKILAEAFRSKCMDTRVATARGLPQAGLHSGFPQMTAVLSPSPPTTSIAPVSPHNAATFLPAVHNSTALLSGTSARPPHSISNPTPSNLQGGSQIRARAPHLRPFRPSSSLSVTGLSSLPRGMPSQPEPSYSLAASSLLTQQPMIWRPPPTYQSGSYNSVPQPEIAGGLPALPNSSLSEVGLLMDVENRTIVNPCPPSYASPALEFSYLDPLLAPESGPIRGTQANTSHSSGPPDIVCLSDDD
ncbi:helicase protein MOM1-like isoform X2 [Tripterygium wilfordii]|uniref:helicase protein MOM1-like isoform X2 n=1 Tax=Tripterygium wilfordii TaxID=458696 RepID=UPI0018F7F231|nr:helicase protein MOM1-like isoform X2 [Tripterygium wilfordii]